jgi:hypothetical protein
MNPLWRKLERVVSEQAAPQMASYQHTIKIETVNDFALNVYHRGARRLLLTWKETSAR